MRIGPAELFFLCIMVAILGGVFLGALRIWKGEGGKARQTNNAEEARLIQDIYHGLLKMEERVEALETLLLERERESEKKEAQS
ncbi:MAG: phage-shock protein [Candidatus Hydrogenedentes bacterium]|nr:phage-shock protein [Candidatus Hydrogenedentota bacterium]